MNLTPRGKQAVQVLLNPQGQTPAKLHEVMIALLGHAGCNTCGRMIKLDVEFGVDPGPDAGQSGVISAVQT
jgi:hypothetical protein